MATQSVVPKDNVNQNNNGESSSALINQQATQGTIANSNKQMPLLPPMNVNNTFDTSEAISNFSKGFFSGITGILDSFKKHLLFTSSMLIGITTAVVAVPTLGVPLVAFGFAYAGFKLLQSGYYVNKAIREGNGDIAEKEAMHALGESVFAGATAALGVKAALNTVNVETKSVSILNATLIFLKSPKLSLTAVVEGYKTIKSGEAITNLINFGKSLAVIWRLDKSKEPSTVAETTNVKMSDFERKDLRISSYTSETKPLSNLDQITSYVENVDPKIADNIELSHLFRRYISMLLDRTRDDWHGKYANTASNQKEFLKFIFPVDKLVLAEEVANKIGYKVTFDATGKITKISYKSNGFMSD